MNVSPLKTTGWPHEDPAIAWTKRVDCCAATPRSRLDNCNCNPARRVLTC